ncbi:hypothetical protein PIB30_009188 [Stylosanthes scabra]|uniref:Plastocyanin-like domain-containing protein n=1 Tax=Stylosanthes scabra TaxID=79078 RepID=A0ABU6Y1R0_9FABA|nr:hypothetical protein [Stylosanthes scabra]
MPKTPLWESNDTQSHEILKKLCLGTSQSSWQTHRRLRRRPASSAVTHSCRYHRPKLCHISFGRLVVQLSHHLHPTSPSESDETPLLSSVRNKIGGVFEMDFSRKLENEFNYTGNKLPEYVLETDFGSRVLVLEYNVEAWPVKSKVWPIPTPTGDNHLVHFHGYNFYVVGSVFGNFDPKKDPHKYNLVDLPQETIVGVPKNGWVALRWRATKFCISGVLIGRGHCMLNNA